MKRASKTPLTERAWDRSKFVKLSGYKKKETKFRKDNPYVVKVMEAMKEAASKELQGFSEEEKEKCILTALERMEEEVC